MTPTKSYKPRRNSSRYTANNQIRFPEVRVLSAKGEQLGVMSSQEALQRARDTGVDLVLITENAKPPVVKIIDLAKFKYQQQQREADQRKSARSSEIKEVRFTPFMSDNDYQSRLKKVVRFIEKKDKVRLSLQFRGRAITKKEFGFDLFQRIADDTQEIAKYEVEPKMMGKKLVAQLAPIK